MVSRKLAEDVLEASEEVSAELLAELSLLVSAGSSVDARVCQQPLKQVFGQVLFSMVTVICGSPCRCNIGMLAFSIEIVAASKCHVTALALDGRTAPRLFNEHRKINSP